MIWIKMDISQMVNYKINKLNWIKILVFVFLGELFQVLKMMVGSNLKDSQLQQIVDKVRWIGKIFFFFN